MSRIKKQSNLGKKCPECEDGYLHSVFRNELHGGAEFEDEYIECDECEYSYKINNKRNKIHVLIE